MPYTFGRYELDTDKNTLKRDGEVILKPKNDGQSEQSFVLLEYFLRNPNRFLPHFELQKLLWPELAGADPQKLPARYPESP